MWTPSILNSDAPFNADKWAAEIEENAPYFNFDLMIGHSSGVPLLLKLLSKKFTAKKAIGIAGYITPLDFSNDAGLKFNIENIKINAKSLTFIHSNNDPWGCSAEKQGKDMHKIFGGTLIVKDEEGHFGSEKFNQPYKTFPLLLSNCLMEEKE